MGPAPFFSQPHSGCQQILFCLQNYPEPNYFSPVFVLLPPRPRSLSFLIIKQRTNIIILQYISPRSPSSPGAPNIYSNTATRAPLLKHVLTQHFAENSPMTPWLLKVKSKSWVTEYTLCNTFHPPARHPITSDLWDHSPLWSLCHNQTGLLLDPGTSQGDSCPPLWECSSPSYLFSLLPAFLWPLFLSQPFPDHPSDLAYSIYSVYYLSSFTKT